GTPLKGASARHQRTSRASCGRVRMVHTEWMPQVTVKGMDSRGHRTLAKFVDGERKPLSAAFLSNEGKRVEVCDAVEEFCALYGAWIRDELKVRLEAF